MARYRVIELSYFNERIVEPGEEVQFTGIPGSNLELIGDEQEARNETMAAFVAEAQKLGLQADKVNSLPKLAALIFNAKNGITA